MACMPPHRLCPPVCVCFSMKYSAATGPPVGTSCEHCGQRHQVAILHNSTQYHCAEHYSTLLYDRIHDTVHYMYTTLWYSTQCYATVRYAILFYAKLQYTLHYCTPAVPHHSIRLDSHRLMPIIPSSPPHGGGFVFLSSEFGEGRCNS